MLTRQAAWVVILLLVVGAAVVGTHGRVLSARATTSDDQQYVHDNRLVQNPGWNSVARFFGEVFQPSTVSGYYQPLTMISLMLDCARGGGPKDLRPFRGTSLALHVFNAMLVGALLYLLFGHPWVAAGAALLFGVHPFTVETVAWLAERKTLLAMFFSLWSLIFYVYGARGGSWKLFGLSLGMYLLALLSKPTSLPLPLLMLLLDYWPLRRLSGRAVVEKVPFFVVAGVSAVVTVVSQARAGGVTVPVVDSALRIPLTLCHNIAFYPYKLGWPTNVTFYYPFPEPFDLSNPPLLGGVIGTVLLIPAILISWRWTRSVLTGWLFFFVGIFPTLGVVNFTDVIAANRYAYLPALGLLMILAWLLGRFWDQVAGTSRPGAWHVGLLAVVLCLAALETRGTRLLLDHWQSTESLHRYMLKHAPHAGAVLINLGVELVAQGKIDEAVELYTAALAARSGREIAHYNLGVLLAEQGKFEEAVPHLTEAFRSKAWAHRAHTAMGVLLLRQERFADAVVQFEAALYDNPDPEAAYANLLTAVMRDGSPSSLARALPHFEERLRRNPRSAQAHNDLGNILAARGDRVRAIGHFRDALRLKPGWAEAHFDLGVALLDLQQLDNSAAEFREAIRLRGDFILAHRNLATVLMSQGKIDEAIRVYEAALRRAPDDERLRADLQTAQARRAGPASP